MNVYGYLINLDYQPKEGEVLWDFQRKEADGSIVDYIGIESAIQIETNSNIYIVGDSETFVNWLNQFGSTFENIL